MIMEGEYNDDDDICLSKHAAEALQEFYKERAAIEALQANCTDSYVQEDWELSQFWYDEETASTLANVAIEAGGENGKIACVSSPTVFKQIWKKKSDITGSILFEYDERFCGLFPGHFEHYDYNKPLDVRRDLELSFDVVIVDPPYLSRECLEKVCDTIKFLAKDKIILCTGAVMEADVQKLLGLHVCDFEPKHAKNLGNAFKCYANFDVDSYIGEKTIR